MGGRDCLLVAADVSEIRCIQHYSKIHDETRLRFALSFGLQLWENQKSIEKLASCNDDSNYWFYSLPCPLALCRLVKTDTKRKAAIFHPFVGSISSCVVELLFGVPFV